MGSLPGNSPAGSPNLIQRSDYASPSNLPHRLPADRCGGGGPRHSVCCTAILFDFARFYDRSLRPKSSSWRLAPGEQNERRSQVPPAPRDYHGRRRIFFWTFLLSLWVLRLVPLLFGRFLGSLLGSVWVTRLSSKSCLWKRQGRGEARRRPEACRGVHR